MAEVVLFHGMDADPIFVGEGDIDAARELIGQAEVELGSGGGFRARYAGDISVGGGRVVRVVDSLRGKWTVHDGKLRLRVDPRSLRLTSPSRLVRFGIPILTLVLRRKGEWDVVDDKITRLTATELWLEGSRWRKSGSPASHE